MIVEASRSTCISVLHTSNITQNCRIIYPKALYVFCLGSPEVLDLGVRAYRAKDLGACG